MKSERKRLLVLLLLLPSPFLLLPSAAHAARLRCEIVEVASTPTRVLPANARRTSLLLQNFSPTNFRCTDGSVQEPEESTGDPEYPHGVGFAVSPVEPNVSASGQPGYFGVIQFSGRGTPTGPILCLHRVTGALRALLVCEGQ